MVKDTKIPSPVISDSGPTRWSAGTLTYTMGGLISLFCWLLWGDFAWSMKDRAVPPIMQILLKTFGASDMTTGLLISSIPALFGLVVAPIISYKSDRYRSRWGRRIPFLVLMTPVTVLSMVGLAFSPQLASVMHKLLPSAKENEFALISLGLFWGLFEFGSVTISALFAGLVNDVVPQRVIGRFYGLFRAIGLLAGIFFNYYLLKHVHTAYVAIFIGFGLLYGVAFSLMCVMVKEGDYPPPESASSDGSILSGAKVYFKECFGNSYYVLFYASCALATLTFGPVNLFSIFFATSVGMSTADYGKCLALTYIISLLLAYPFGALADRFHPLRLCIVILGLYAVASLLGGLVAHQPVAFGIMLVIHGVISGMFFTVFSSLAQRLLPRSRFAQLSSAAGILTSILFVLQGPSMGWLLDYTDHNYRFTFLAGSVLSVASLILLFMLHSRFMAMGGPDHYAAPE